MTTPFVTQLSMAFAAVRSRTAVYACGLDLLFFVSYIMLTTAYQAKIFELLQGAVAQTLQPSGATTFFQVFFNEATAPFFVRILLLVLLLFFSVYVLFSAYIGISTYLSFNLPQPKSHKIWPFVKNFFRIMIPWACILALLELIGFYYAYLDTARQTLDLGSTNFPIVNAILLVIIVYVMFISALLPAKKNFRTAWKYAFTSYKMLPAYGIVLSGYIILSVTSLGLLRTSAGSLWVLLVILPLTLAFFVYVRKLFSLAYRQ